MLKVMPRSLTVFEPVDVYVVWLLQGSEVHVLPMTQLVPAPVSNSRDIGVLAEPTKTWVK